MSLLALTNQLKPVDVDLVNLFLDPNNPRFVDSDWVHVLDKDIADKDVQERTRRKLVEHFNVDKLRMNMEVNGYLAIDRVIVRQFGDDQYVVLEGNRRICSAQMISQVASDGSEVQPEVRESLRVIPVLQYTGGDRNAGWLFQGLRHISGIEDWSAFNKAKLLVEQMEEDNIKLTEVGKRFGLTPHGAGQWVRGYYAFKQAREESDFLNEVDERSYPYFQELFSRSSSAVKEWMGWSEETYRFDNPYNFNEFVGWLYPRSQEEDDIGTEKGKGDWERRKLNTRDDIRSMAVLMTEYPDLFQQFRITRQLEEAYSQALARKYEKQARDKVNPVEEAFEAIQACTKALDNLPLRVIRDGTLSAKLNGLLDELRQKIAFVAPND